MQTVVVSLALLPLAAKSGSAQDEAGARTRAAFLRLIDRERVPLSAQSTSRPDSGFVKAERFSFASEAGERVIGLFFKSVRAKGRQPAVIILHGTGAKKEDQLALLRTLAERGFAAIAIDARHHGERARTGAGVQEYLDELLKTYRTGKGHPYLYDTVWDTMRLVDYLETRQDVDPSRIGLMGISKGGTETYLTAAVDPRIAVAVPIIGAQSFRWALEHDAWRPRVATFQSAVDGAARDSGVSRVDAALVRKFYDRVVPGIYGEFDGPAMLSLIAPRPLLIINGDSDARTPLAAVQECAAAATRAYARQRVEEKFGLYLQSNAGHVFTPIAELVMMDWFARWLHPASLYPDRP
jgi:dienelactone hydrolase